MTEGTRVVSAVRREKLQQRWADPKYAERERARLRAMAQEQKDALAFYRQHRADPRLAASDPPSSDDPPPPSPLPTPPARPTPQPRRSGSARRTRPGATTTASRAVMAATEPAAKQRAPFFLRRPRP